MFFWCIPCKKCPVYATVIVYTGQVTRYQNNTATFIWSPCICMLKMHIQANRSYIDSALIGSNSDDDFPIRIINRKELVILSGTPFLEFFLLAKLPFLSQFKSCFELYFIKFGETFAMHRSGIFAGNFLTALSISTLTLGH